jgi:phosphate transport system permease protein
MPLLATNPIARLKSRVAWSLCVVFTVLILAVLLLVTGYLVILGWRSVNVTFFTHDPNDFDAALSGMRNGLIGTVVMVGLAALAGIPLGMLAGIYLAEYSARSWLANYVRFTADVLTGVPSIVVGILGMELIVKTLGHDSGLAGAAALAFIMIPIVARTTEEMLRLVPNSYREASIALGATKARTILRVVVPSATGSLITGVMLALARVAGETAPLLFTAGGYHYLKMNPLGRFPALTLEIYAARTASNPAQQKVGWAGVLVLIFMIFVVNVLIRYFARGRRVSR